MRNLRKVNFLYFQIRYILRDVFTLKLVSAWKKFCAYDGYINNALDFVAMGGNIDEKVVLLEESSAEAGTIKSAYFHQDLLVATYIYKNRPTRHIDVGSRVDGFIGNVASFRKIDVFDIRPLSNIGHDNINFIQFDFMSSVIETEITDSISCLHAIEHFGLGRYGDRINPNGHHIGFSNLIKLLKPSGRLYISFPIGSVSKVCFNAHRIFSAADIFSWPDIEKLRLINFDYIDEMCNIFRNQDPKQAIINFEYGCGVYIFEKK